MRRAMNVAFLSANSIHVASAEPVGSTPEEYDAFVRSEIAKWAKVCKEAGIQPE